MELCHRILGMRVKFLLIAVFSTIVVFPRCHAQTTISAVPTPRTDSKSAENDTSLDLPPLPRSEVSLIGGTVMRMDTIRDRIVVRVFGGRDLTLDFDVRTQFLQGATSVSARDIRPGTRIYADTIEKEGKIFAKAIRIGTGMPVGEARGQVIDWDAGTTVLRVRDVISSQPFSVHIGAGTEIRADGRVVPTTDLVPGSLVHVTFRSGSEGTNSAQKIDVVARPGSVLTFAGKIVVVDLRDEHLTLAESRGNSTFEVALDSLPQDAKLRLRQGEDVIVQARFDGHHYQAQSIESVPNARP
jgi:hypothetical protein